MNIDNDDRILRSLADGRSIDYSIWPSLLERLTVKLEKIAITDFQIPKPPTYPPPPHLHSPPNASSNAENPSSSPPSWLNKREPSLPHTGSNDTNSGGASPRGEVRTESTETIDGPNGPGGVETVSVSVNGISSVGSHAMMSLLSSQGLSNSGEQGLRAEGGVTQGELLRQEQKAGVVPASQLRVMQREIDREEGARRVDESGLGEGGNVPHARGPEAIGMEDMGPQEQGKVGGEVDIEAAVGRRADFTDGDEVQKRRRKEGEEVSEDVVESEDVKTTGLKRAADDDIGSEAGEKRIKEEMDIEPQPDLESSNTVKKEEKENEVKNNEATDTDTDTKMETNTETETETKTDVVDANEGK
ncbi:hypothetical protein DID88_000271 [Monilinia fructigena]|uniref:Uncharacterized protein n=1 Tax=Monilinia fructigena TaxID=38457 RepID=A0A395IJX4_9HELO|nr:hypothetical protein DID88_000271 [Monilinia fructigena]